MTVNKRSILLYIRARVSRCADETGETRITSQNIIYFDHVNVMSINYIMVIFLVVLQLFIHV